MINELISSLYNIQHSYFYYFVLFYIGLYPIWGAILWSSTAIFYYFRKEKVQQDIPEDNWYPKVSVLISSHNEEANIATALDSLCVLNYPDYEIVIVDDGSTDNTKEILRSYVADKKIRLISKDVNQGKAIALNDALICLNGEIVLFMDADAEVDPDILKYLIPHFKNARVAAVAGNPRIKNASNFLCRMQILEYASIIGTIRRAQRVWGRIMTFSGVVFAARKSAVFNAGGFDPAAPTEDIDLTWKLQKNFQDVFYEPRAIAWTLAPETYKSFFKQRLRWARGLMYVIHVNFKLLFTWKLRRMWPVLIENLLSQFWVLCAISMFIFWSISLYTGYSLHISFIPPLTWGMAIATVNIISQIISINLDSRYDPQLKNYYFYTVYFPIYYWLLLAFVAFIELPRLFIKPKPTLGWSNVRDIRK